MHDHVIRHIVDVDKLRLIPKKHVASPLGRISPRSHSCEAWLNQNPAVASLLDHLTAHQLDLVMPVLNFWF